MKEFMLFIKKSCCFKCKKNTESKKPKFRMIKNERMMFSSNCAVRGS